jgi:alpha,alpha-trehalase
MLCLALPSVSARAAEQQTQTRKHSLDDILSYISAGWDALTRSMTRCETVSKPGASEKAVLYLPAGFPIPAAVRELQKKCAVRLEHLPAVIEKLGEIEVSRIHPQGLLYLEHPYVVPGGMFNEMYGWDSYFILRGLLRAGKIELARGMAENFFFEIDHYGGVLNANRSYFLTRSQPPFLTSMILAVYDAGKSTGQPDGAWLEKAYRYGLKDYQFWTREPHLAGDTGLSRYYDLGEGPAPEVSTGYYRYVARHFLLHRETGRRYLTRMSPSESPSALLSPVFSLYVCDSAASSPPGKGCEVVENLSLTADLYKGDRSMRESGFDISFRFEPFSAGTHHFAPVCLNSLLYKAEKDLEEISALLGRQAESLEWHQRAEQRRERVEKYLWDKSRGLFFDYNFQTRTQSSYEFAATFYPLWAGLASPAQAQAVVRNLDLFEQPGGLAMSRQETKAQWDYPYGWAPVHLLAVEGLRRYGYHAEANRISYNFLSMILQNFRRDRTIREKYNVVTRSSETQVEAGYKENVIGFGWTNGVFAELLHGLPQELAARLAAE